MFFVPTCSVLKGNYVHVHIFFPSQLLGLQLRVKIWLSVFSRMLSKT